MNVAPGSRLGPYEILAPIGAGGMGEVWKARDTRLDRNVAVKILPSDFAQNVQLRVRFEREAKTISQLHHPNICTLFDVGDDFLVMEYLEGETLADRLSRGALPLPDVLKVGAQIAHALDKAHRAGIVHRDLKPGNIMLTKSGAKLLDFGLARTTQPSASLTAKTEQKPLTQEGTILGTWQYMAPEQLAAEEADERSDIFAFGAVLYETLTGVRAFEGKSKTSVIAAIVGAEPRPVTQLQPLTPAALEHVIAKCLAKEPDDRWQSAADVAAELEWISRSSFEEVDKPVAKRRVTWRRFVNAALALAIVATIALGAVAFRLNRRLAVAEEPVRAELLMPNSLARASVVRGAIALSPDGTRLAAIVGPRARSLICVRDLRTGATTNLVGTEGATFPFWSPDGMQIGFFGDRKLKKIPAAGGPIDILADAPQGRGAAWGAGGAIVFAPNLVGPLCKVSEAGGPPVAVTKPAKGWTHRNPVFLPDGRTFLFTARDTMSMSEADLYSDSVDGGTPKLVFQKASNVAFDGGRLFFVRNRNLVAQRFDLKTLQPLGVPVPVAENLEYYNPRDLGNFAVAGGRIAYITAYADPVQLGIYDRTARQLDIKGQPGFYSVLDASPDGKTVALAVGNGDAASDVWVMDLERGVMSRVTFADATQSSAVFSPDGKRLATVSGNSGGSAKLVIHTLQGSATEEVVSLPGSFQVTSWSPDGKNIVGQLQSIDTAHDVGYVPLDHPKFIPVVHTPAEEVMPVLSPDGKWLAYMSLETGQPQIYVTSFPSGEGKWQVTATGGAAPRWTRDGKQLLYVNAGANTLSTVEVRPGPTPQFGTPVPLPVAIADRVDLVAAYATTPGGNIITAKMAREADPAPIHLITNWPSLLPPD